MSASEVDAAYKAWADAVAARQAAQQVEADAEQMLRQARGEDARIALRPGRAGLLYDVVVNEVSMVRIKRINDQWWIACYLAALGDEERITFTVDGGTLRVGEQPEPTDEITYEVQS